MPATKTPAQTALLTKLPEMFVRFEDPCKNNPPTVVQDLDGNDLFTVNARVFDALWASGALVHLDGANGTLVFGKA